MPGNSRNGPTAVWWASMWAFRYRWECSRSQDIKIHFLAIFTAWVRTACVFILKPNALPAAGLMRRNANAKKWIPGMGPFNQHHFALALRGGYLAAPHK